MEIETSAWRRLWVQWVLLSSGSFPSLSSFAPLLSIYIVMHAYHQTENIGHATWCPLDEMLWSHQAHNRFPGYLLFTLYNFNVHLRLSHWHTSAVELHSQSWLELSSFASPGLKFLWYLFYFGLWITCSSILQHSKSCICCRYTTSKCTWHWSFLVSCMGSYFCL